MNFLALLGLIGAAFFVPEPALACTSMMAGPEATADGNPWVGQSDDGEGASDRRLVWVPAQDWPEGALRPVFDYEDYPRLVDTSRKVPAYYPSKRLPNKTSNVIGSIPQVSHTYGYFEGNYAVSNEHGLSFGESTCSSKTYAKKVSQGGPSLLSMYELTRLAAERTTTARAAVLLMGEMASKYGFYGDAAPDTGGESVLVADREEQFIFHVLPESNVTGGAIWAAQRIPRNHVTIVANAFVIGFINATDSDNFLFSSNMHSVALSRKWWDGKSQLHFTRAFSGGEYTSRYYSGRRMYAFWRALAPSLNVPPEYDSYRQSIGVTYPVSAKPDKLVTRDDILTRVYRNYLEGTPYDLSVGMAAGPFGQPVRYKPGPGEEQVAGKCGSLDDAGVCNHWERPIAVFRTTMIYLTSIPADATAATIWFLPGAALTGAFIPVVVSSRAVPTALSDCHNTFADRNQAMWSFREMGQFAYPRWNTLKEKIRAAQAEAENAGERAANLSGELVADAIEQHATDVVQMWQNLYLELLVQFSDGWSYSLSGGAKHVGYPAWWLKQVGFLNGPPSCKSTCDVVADGVSVGPASEACLTQGNRCADASDCCTNVCYRGVCGGRN